MTRSEVDAVEIIAADGAVLRGQRWVGNSTWVILLHESGDDADLDRWMPLAPHLAGRGWSVLAVDLRGHGASDGDWDPRLADRDVAVVVEFARSHGAAFVCLGAAGDSATTVLRLAGEARPDVLVLLSPKVDADQPVSDLRGAGEAKLIVAGGGNTDARASAERLGKAAIGPVLVLNLPAHEQGTALLHGEVATHLREHVIGFLAEQRFLAGLREQWARAGGNRTVGRGTSADMDVERTGNG